VIFSPLNTIDIASASIGLSVLVDAGNTISVLVGSPVFVFSGKVFGQEDKTSDNKKIQDNKDFFIGFTSQYFSGNYTVKCFI